MDMAAFWKELLEDFPGFEIAAGDENDPTPNFICPCGLMIEPDGWCPVGHKSPLLSLGMI